MSPALRWLLTPLFVLAFAEAWAWVMVPTVQVGPSFRMPDPELGMVMRRNADTVRWARDYTMHWSTGAQGYRGESVEGPPPEGALRVVSVGNSNAFGVGVDDDQTWAAIAESRLDRPDRPVDVVNAAVTDAGTEDFLVRLDEFLALEPDVLVLRHDEYNFMQCGRFYEADGVAVVEKPAASRRPSTLVRTLEQVNHTPFIWSALYAHARARFKPVMRMVKATREAYLSLPHRADQKTSEQERERESFHVELEPKVLDRLARELDEAGVALVLVQFGYSEEQEAALAPILAAHELPVVDASDLVDDPDYHFVYDHHINADGHALVGERLAELLDPMLRAR